MSGLRFVSSVRFEMIDEDGTLIGPIPMVVDDSWGFLRFVGMVTVPDRPFRVRTVGVSVGGKRFLGTYQKLFRPGPPRPPEAVQTPPDLPPEMAAIVPQLLEEGAKLLAEATAAREAQVKGLDGEVMTRVPRLRITNVSFAPYRSPRRSWCRTSWTRGACRRHSACWEAGSARTVSSPGWSPFVARPPIASGSARTSSKG